MSIEKMELSAHLPGYVRRQLRKKGYTFLGEGEDGQAWLSPSRKRVLKIVPRQDKSYRRFVSVCQKVPNKHLPIIYDTAVTADKKLFMVLTEYLKPADALTEHAVDILLDKGAAGVVSKDTLYFIKKEKYQLADVERLAKRLEPTMMPVIKLLIKNHPHKANALDGAYTNVLMRGRTPVLIDPYTE